MDKKINTQSLLMDKAKKIASSSEEWIKFMSSSAYTYKYPFEDQILIYAHRPEARACASMDFWNKRFHRWVNKGAKGIPLIDYNSGGYPKLKYVFDISDTHPTRYTIRDVNLWQFNIESDLEAIAKLEKTFNIIDISENVEERILKMAEELTKIRLEDILYDIDNYKEYSFMDGLDEINTKTIARNLISKSLAFIMLKRMDLNPVSYFEKEDFKDIINFNSFDMISVRRQIKAPTNCIPKSNYNYKPNNYLAINCI